MVSGKRQHLRAKLVNWAHCGTEVIRSWMATDKKWRVLFSDSSPEWENAVRKSFRYTPHMITFAKLTLENIRRHDLVIPLTMNDVKHLSSDANLAPGNPIPVPCMEAIRLCEDKVLLNEFLVDHGYQAHVPVCGNPLPYPYIVKKRIDTGGRHSHVVARAEQAEAVEGLLASEDYFSQQFIPGPREYAVHIVVRNRKILYALNIEYCFASDYPVKGRDEAIYRKICSCPYLDQFAAMIITSGFEGLCNVNYKIHNGVPYVLEINPRCGSSFHSYLFLAIRHLGGLPGRQDGPVGVKTV